MTDTKVKKPRNAFKHEALDEIEAEKRALRTVLRAIHLLEPRTAMSVLNRSLAVTEQRFEVDGEGDGEGEDDGGGDSDTDF